MPGPAVYIVAVVVSVGATIAFKEFVYDPHIKPKFQEWRDNYKSRHQRNRRTEEPVSSGRRRRGRSRDSSASDNSNDHPNMPSVELETLVSREVDEWRNDGTSSSNLRQRRPAEPSALDEDNAQLPYPTMAPSQRRSVSPTITLGSSPEVGSSLGHLDLPLSPPSDLPLSPPSDLPLSPPSDLPLSPPSDLPPNPRSPPVAALPMSNVTSFGSDTEFNASIYQTPESRATALPISPSSPDVVVVSPFSDPLAMSHEFVSAPSEASFHEHDDDDNASAHSGIMSPGGLSSVTQGDFGTDSDSDDWADVENASVRQ